MRFGASVRRVCAAWLLLSACEEDRSDTAFEDGVWGSATTTTGGDNLPSSAPLADGGGIRCGVDEAASPAGGGCGAPAPGCEPTQYEVAPGECAERTVCAAGFHESVPPTATADRDCLPDTPCGAEEFQSVPPTATADRVCALLTRCEAGSYVSTPATALQDRRCEPCAEGSFTQMPNESDCRPFTECTEGQRETQAGSPRADRTCESCGGSVQAVVSFAADAQRRPELHEDITRCIQAALDAWTAKLVAPTDVTIEVRIATPNIPTASGASLAQPRLPDQDGRTVYEAGVAYEIRTGEDPNGSDVDALINLGSGNLDGRFWFDPDPWERSASVPRGAADATSVCMHEMGHVLGFNGYIDGRSWRVPGGYATNYDLHSIPDGDHIDFVGARSGAAYGADVPETSNSPVHLGNLRGPGADLDEDVMHGTPTRPNYHYVISETDWGILADLGLPVVGTPAAEDSCAPNPLARRVYTAPELGPPVPLRE